ncbi:class I SAM-dependent methyltransferase [Hazenella coriacea]|uniref:Methyltransferase family protein n=1 Tax=Hazenella coriacea TaxID=1179467 RepID=A0A4R3LAH5_9BACL|nr:class I SAM-dependent methyltransferase [Hazenella coriacea]TCS96853.1 methyltransferase family protein [Hazenella coriacea]
MFQKDLVLQEYKNSRRLNTRVQFHVQYSQAPEPFLEWAIQQVNYRGDEHVLDAGCGTGVYLFPIANLLREKGGSIVGMDLSSGLLEELQEKVVDYPNIELIQGDLQQTLPFPDETFDIVMANFVVYHVEHINHTIQELKRVLKPGGRMIVGTGSQKNFYELEQIHIEAKKILAFPSEAIHHRNPYTRFSLENGAIWLRPHFPWFELHTQYDQIMVDQVEPVLEYYASGMMELGIESGTELREEITEEMIEDLYQVVRKKIEKVIDREGVFRMQKQAGFFIATK